MSRRSISVRGVTYDALRVYCDEHDQSMSDVVEQLLAPVLSIEAPVPAAPKPRKGEAMRGHMRAAALEGAAKKRAPPPPGARDGADGGGHLAPSKVEIPPRTIGNVRSF